MPLVYCVNRGGHDYSAAERFGQLFYLTEGKLEKYDVSQMMRECEFGLADSTPEDYILLTSLTTLCSVACSMFAHRHGRLNLLIHKGEGYVERKLVLEVDGNSTRRTR